MVSASWWLAEIASRRSFASLRVCDLFVELSRIVSRFLIKWMHSGTGEVVVVEEPTGRQQLRLESLDADSRIGQSFPGGETAVVEEALRLRLANRQQLRLEAVDLDSGSS